MDTDQVNEALRRRLQCGDASCVTAVAFPSFDTAVQKIKKGGLHFYTGIDATAPQLHIGHTIPLLLLKNIAAFGNRITVLFGDFTSRIGDPTDKTATRTTQTKEEVQEHLATYLSQVQKILPERSFQVRRNSEWLESMTFDTVTELATHVTVQQMLSRDMFQERIKNEKPIFLSEFLYPLMQGYDSVALDIDGEVGGNDQTFNMLVGRDLLKKYRGKDKIVLPVRLLVDPITGKKIGKSEGGFIALQDTPDIIFEKVTRSISDKAVKAVFELCTEVPGEEIEKKYSEAEKSGVWRPFNLALAEELVRMYHGEEAVQPAREAYERSVRGMVAEDEEAISVSGSGQTPMTHLLAEALGISKSEAKRLIEQRAVTKSGELVTDPLGPSGAQDGDVFRVGSHRPFRIKLTS